MNIFNTLLLTITIVGLSLSQPITRRQEKAGGDGGLTDLQILQFALTLEHLESAFYTEGLSKFPASDFLSLGLDPSSITTLRAISQTESTHIQTLNSVIRSLNATPVPPCTYTFQLPTATSMLSTARVLEAVGISAYLGAAPLIQNPAILSAAASIVTVESRHQTFLRSAIKADPVPQAFDVAIGPRMVFSLVSGFIKDCPKEADLGLKQLPELKILDAGMVREGSSLKMVLPEAQKMGISCVFVTGDMGMRFVPLENGACRVPEGLGGETYLLVTREAEGVKVLADEMIVAGPAVLVLS